MNATVTKRAWFCCVGVGILAACVPAEAYQWRYDKVGVSFDAPPVLLQMIDARGSRMGADFTRTISACGIAEYGDYFCDGDEFRSTSTTSYDPGSPVGFVMQDNRGDDDPESPDFGKPNASTGWDLTLMDGGTATYDLVYRGMVSATSWVWMHAKKKLPTGYSQMVETKTPVLVEPGVERRLRMMVDPEAQTIRVARVVSATELEWDAGLACRLGMVSPGGICQSLVAKAKAISEARSRGRTEAARGATKAFLNELAAQGGKHIQEPAFTILREEAEALLNPPPPMPKPKKAKAGQ